jgi:hypothetical protein
VYFPITQNSQIYSSMQLSSPCNPVFLSWQPNLKQAYIFVRFCQYLTAFADLGLLIKC